MPLILPFEGEWPDIDPTAWIAPNATVIGRVRIGANASVFYGAVLRGDINRIELGAGSNLQDNVVVHVDDNAPAIIGAGVGVGHSAIVHGAVVEDGSLIGMGATLLNNAVIGEGSLIAAGALVLENAVIPPRSLAAGVPAKVRGTLDEAGLERARSNAVGYRELSARHRASQELESQESQESGD